MSTLPFTSSLLETFYSLVNLQLNDQKTFFFSFSVLGRHYCKPHSWDKYNETSLLPKVKFFSYLKNRVRTGGDYKRAQKVYRAQIMSNLVEYNDDYDVRNIVLSIDV